MYELYCYYYYSYAKENKFLCGNFFFFCKIQIRTQSERFFFFFLATRFIFANIHRLQLCQYNKRIY